MSKKEPQPQGLYSLSVLKDRLYQALGAASQASPWQKVNVAAQSSSVQQPRTSTYHATANTGYNTTTAGQTSSYSNPNPVANGPSMPTYNVNNPLSGTSVPSYNTGNVTAAASVPSYGGPLPSTGTSAANKGPLANKYPSTASNSYNGTAGGYGGNTYNPADYSQQPQPYYYSGQQYMQPAGSVQPAVSTMQPTSTPTQGFNQPTTDAYGNTMHSFQDYKPDKAWNDPPMVVKKDKPKVSQAPAESAPITNPIYGSQGQMNQAPPGGQMSYGNFYNPQEYKPEVHQSFSSTPQPTYTNSTPKVQLSSFIS